MLDFDEKDRLRLTKIVATVPGNCSRAFLEKLYRNGMDVARMNSAHMTLAEMENVTSAAREVAPELAVMLDTKGPNIRTCNIPQEGIPLKKGDVLRLSGMPGTDGRIQVSYPPFAQEVPSGSRIVCDDGAAAFRVIGKEEDCLLLEALFDCVLQNHKSINVPDVALKAPALTEKDREFLAAAVRLQCDFVAHSFVRSADDVREVRQALGEAGRDIAIIAKIENREGVAHLKEILQAADGIMVARGDLGIEIPLEKVPEIQKNMIHEARLFAKPVITATQMLQSMESAPTPTRAEVSDVANAVYDGTDAVMLSGETAHGKFPAESVAMMRRIVMEAERAPRKFFPVLEKNPDVMSETGFILSAAVKSLELLPVQAIICSTLNGRSARVCSAYRPLVPVYAPTPCPSTMRKLSLSYGTFSTQVAYQDTPQLQVREALKHLQGNDLPGDMLLALVGKHHPNDPRNNLLCISTLDKLLQELPGNISR